MKLGVNADFSSKKANGFINGEADGRPPPGLVVPGAHEVPEGAISREKIYSAALLG